MKRLKIVLISALLTVTVGAFAGWSGSGSFTRTHDWTDDAAAGIPITASRMDAEDDNFATGINACLAKNGENAATSNLNIGGYRLTSVGAGSAATDAATIGGIETLTNKTLTSPTLTSPTLTSPTLTSPSITTPTVSGTTEANISISSGTGGTVSNAIVYFKHNGTTRWSIYKSDDAESGSNAGSNLQIGRYTDAGSFIDLPVVIDRATGDVTLTGSLQHGGLVSGTYTTASLESGSEDSRAITHGLGTDNVDFGAVLYGSGAIGSGKFNVNGRITGVGGEFTDFGYGAGTAPTTFPALPSTGDIQITVRNNHTGAQTITVKWWARARD